MDLGKQFRMARRKAQLSEDLVLYCARHDYGTRVLDVRLPGMSGIQVCHELRQSGNTSPVLMLTARALVEQRGARDVERKPLARRHGVIRYRKINTKIRDPRAIVPSRSVAEPEDGGLLVRVQAPDTEALGLLFHRYPRLLLGIARRTHWDVVPSSVEGGRRL